MRGRGPSCRDAKVTRQLIIWWFLYYIIRRLRLRDTFGRTMTPLAIVLVPQSFWEASREFCLDALVFHILCGAYVLEVCWQVCMNGGRLLTCRAWGVQG